MKPQRSGLVWYASYGSNLSYQSRFRCYLMGGRPAGSRGTNPGCRDKSPPLDKKPISLHFQLYFAGYAASWGGAAAFIRRGKNSVTLGRMYLITEQQFNDVVLQENGRVVDGTCVVPLEQIASASDFLLSDDLLYGRLVFVGREGEYPILTFTATRDELQIAVPSEAYVKVIVSGLKETYPDMTDREICEYLAAADGIRDMIQGEELSRWVRESK